jgi:hypothetical protein
VLDHLLSLFGGGVTPLLSEQLPSLRRKSLESTEILTDGGLLIRR